MKKLLLVVVGLAVILAVTLVMLHRPEPTPAASAILPATTVALVDIPDFQSCRTKVAASPLNLFWQDPEVQTCLAALTGTPAVPANLTALLTSATLGLPAGEAFAAVTRITTLPDLQFSFAAGVDLRSHKLEAQASLKLLEYELHKTNPANTSATHKHRGMKYSCWQLAGGSQVCHTFFGSLLVVTTDEDSLRDLIGRYKNKPDGSALAASAGYPNLLRLFPAPQDLHAYLNVEQLVSRFGLLLFAVAPNNSFVQQLAAVQAWGDGMTFAETGITDVGLTIFLKPHPPALAIWQTTLAAAPADSNFYLAGSPDLVAGYNLLLELAKMTGNPTTASLVTALELVLPFAGVRPAEDLIAKLGPEVAGIGNWRPGAPAPDLALVAEVRDQPALIEKFNRLAKLLNKTLKTTDDIPVAGETLHVIRTGSGYASPTYALTANYFVVALTADYASEIITQIKTGAPGLVLKNAAATTYCDLRHTLAGLYSLAGTNTFAPLGQLPAPETIARYVGTYTATTVDTPTASTTTAHSALGKPVTLLIALAGGYAAAQPWLAANPELPRPFLSRPTPPPPAGNQTATSQTPAP